MAPDHDEANRPKRFLTGFAIVMALAFPLIVYGLILSRAINDSLWLEVTRNHFAAVMGIPIASSAAFIVVLVLKATVGPLEFEAIGFRFRGASGPVVLWVLCFLAVVAAVKVLW